MDRRLFLCGASSALGFSVLTELARSENEALKGRPLGCRQIGNRKDNRPAKWARRDLAYCIYNRDVEELSPLDWDSEFRRAFNSWEQVINFRFHRTEKIEDASIIIAVGDHPAELFGEAGEVLAWAQMPRSPRHKDPLITKYDAAENWLVEPLKDGNRKPASDGIHLEAVACHEIGHILGLEHLPFHGSLMYPYYNPGISEPQNFDIEYARYLYKA